MKIVEIFSSIEGEGKRVGLPVTFVRLYGCNLRCNYCDTKYSYDNVDDESNYTIMSVEGIAQVLLARGISNITITGGEPLIHEGIGQLIRTLLSFNFNVNVETNGTRTLPLEYVKEKNVFVTMDYKCPSSEMEKWMSCDNVNMLRDNHDVLKFVVGTREDLDKAKCVLDTISSKPLVYFSPVFGQIEPKDIVEFLLSNGLYDCYVQVQLHKIIWHQDKRGV